MHCVISIFNTLTISIYSRHFGGGPQKLIIYTQTAANLCALNLLGRDNELQIYHGNFLLMDNKHRKLFLLSRVKRVQICA